MTEFSVLGSPAPPKEPKKTVFTHILTEAGKWDQAGLEPREWKEVILVRVYHNGLGVFIAKGYSGNNLYLGEPGDEFGDISGVKY